MARLRVLAIAESAAGAEVLGAGLAHCGRLRVLALGVGADALAVSDFAEKPDVAIVEIGAGDSGGLARVGELSELDVPVVAVLAAFDQAADAWHAGARGLMLAGAADAWQPVIEVVAGGGMACIGTPIALMFFEEAGAEERRQSVTAREVEVLRLVVDGRSNAEIARALGISESGVKFHLRMCSDKLGVQGRCAIAIVALRLGVLSGWRGDAGGG